MMQVVARLWSRWPFGCSQDDFMSGGGVFIRRWIREEDGQDLIEYALLCGAVGFAGTVAFSFISTAMNSTYTSWDNAVRTICAG